MTEVFATDWFRWGVGLILGFQLLVVLLGEAIYRAERRELPIGDIFRTLRNIVLPLSVLFVFLTRLLEIERGTVLVRLVETALWTSVVYAVLLGFNVVVFDNAAKESWRSRAPKLFKDLVRVLLVVIGAAIVLSVVWRQDLGGLVAALGVGSIVLGLALQETLGNLMSGIALFFERPFSVGEFISVGDKTGVVEQVSWRSVHLRTVERNLLVLPNSAIGRETITNYSRPTPHQILRLSFSFGLDAPPNLVNRMGELLTKWTGRRWVVSVSREEGAQTLSQAAAREAERVLSEAAAHPLVKAALETFPGAAIEAVRDLGAAEGASIGEGADGERDDMGGEES